MMITVYRPEQRFPMKKAMNEVEVGFPPKRDNEKESDYNLGYFNNTNFQFVAKKLFLLLFRLES